MIEMKTKIFYFTGTGNSLFIAKKIAKNIKGALLEPIAGYSNKKSIVIKEERIGFVFPLYFGGMPRIMHQFIKKAEFKDPKYIFAVVNAGVPISGAALSQLKTLLKEKSLKLNSGFYIQMPDNFIPYYKIPSKEKIKSVIVNAVRKIDKITKDIIENKNINRFEISIIKKIISEPWLKKISLLPKGFSYDDRCNGCKTCFKVCPLGNITMKKNRPVWGENCEFCLACINICPKESIEYKNSTGNKGRYFNPEISIKEIMLQR